jgi:hypothetical protein
MELIRLYGPGFVCFLLTCAAYLVVTYLIFKYVPHEQWGDKGKAVAKTVLSILITVTVIIYAFSLISSLTTNVTPRGVIDRSQTLDQQKAFEQRHTQQKGVEQ